MAFVKVFSYNIHKGFGPGLRKYTLHRIRDAIRDAHPDLVFLQEVSGQHLDHKQSQFEYLSEDLWPHFSYGKNAVYVGGHHGNAVLSKFPIVSWKNIDISLNRFEKRGLLHAQLQVPSGEIIHAFCTHLNLLEAGRSEQVSRIVAYIERNTRPEEAMIFAGDFNDWRQRVSLKLRSSLVLQEVFVEKRGRAASTFPSVFPLLCLDRIYTRGFEVQDVSQFFGKPWTQLSDHLPLQATLSRVM